ncbi:MAG: hypothetical protein U0169_20945 [Polyangiaceae bacterium]
MHPRRLLPRLGSATGIALFVAFAGIAAGTFSTTGCIDITPKEKDAGASAAVDEGGIVTAQSDGGPSGSGCAQDPISKVTLCTTVSVCPTIAVDHDLFPNCGYRIRKDGFVLECWCNGYVCPMGTPTTCQQVSDLLAQQSEVGVCTQVEEGRCTGGSAVADAGTSGSGQLVGCDRDCMKTCGGSEDCQRLCGCK